MSKKISGNTNPNAQAWRRPPRFAIDRTAIAAGVARVAGAELHHMRDVMRLGAGADVVLIADDGEYYAGRVARYEAEHAIIEIGAASAVSPDAATIILAPAIIKGPRMDFLIEKSVELGASAIWLLACSRGVVRDPGAERLARWRRLAVAAAKQSLAPHPIEVRGPLSLAEMVRTIPPRTLALVCAEGGAPLGSAICRARLRAILIACGPEGDFAPEERAALAAAGFTPAGLGPRRLRSETAALAALAIARAACEEIDDGY
jgi:16S rRNA (uracil1498-N3)-methyltransferase